MINEFRVLKAFIGLVGVRGKDSSQKVGKDKGEVALSFTIQK